MAVEVELVPAGEPAPGGGRTLAAPADEHVLRRAAEAAAAAAGAEDGHLAVVFVDREGIHALNRAHRAEDRPTDVLSFPLDGPAPAVAGPRELGDVVICPAETADIVEAVAHGVLHLCGHDHEADGGEMLALQRRVLADVRP